MKTLVICHSRPNGNTARLARAIADELGAQVRAPAEVTAGELAAADLVGFGSGIYLGRTHPDIDALVRSAPARHGRHAFIFTTAGTCSDEYVEPLARLLEERGWLVAGRFTCPGRDDYRFPNQCLNPDRPDESDLAAARAFARELVPGID